ncbi:sensor histidine kinase [Chitinivibrio alkaliphilus]|uniref:Histidine kinase family n=1 Tax=Chitinivibrio alkaliphilus ACht1 TaxID=1313304 RepID=U7DA74_9BACT|nr:histidine kinase [Chitinivibrio alkaliphilus]ERP32027.1 histidine kinase family [Chitinivibrio alkaliphilus ACht1]
MSRSVILLILLGLCLGTVHGAVPTYSISPDTPTAIFLQEWHRTEHSPAEDTQSVLFSHSRHHPLELPGRDISLTTHISVPNHGDLTKDFLLSIPVLLHTYHIYWNGTPIGHGQYDSQENTSSASRHHRIPQYHIQEENTLTIDFSTAPFSSGGMVYPIRLGHTEEVLLHNRKDLALSFFLGGIFLTTAVFHLLLLSYRGRRRTNTLFGLYSLCCAGYVCIDAIIRFGSISATHVFPLLISLDFLWLGLILLLPLFLLSHFKASYRHITGTLLTVLSCTVLTMARLSYYNIIPLDWAPFWYSVNLLYGYLATLFAITIALGATLKKRRGSKTILSGLILFFIALIIGTSAQGVGNSWIIGVSVLNIFITIAIGKQLSQQLKNSYRSEIKSTRLELELLKRHIHPHFLLNSLHSIVAWIEEDPPTATRLITHLSRELRYLMAFAGQDLVVLSEEIKLCQSHLSVMNMRKEQSITLQCSGDYRETIKIPPLILHTLIENGLTHGFSEQEEGYFLLDCHRGEKDFTINLSNDGNSRGKTETSGTGSAYIKSRLQEAYGTEWSLSGGPVGGGWKWTICIRNIYAYRNC